MVQRVVFLHEELMKLPSFPRKALEADLDLYQGGELGKVINISIIKLIFVQIIITLKCFKKKNDRNYLV